MKKLLFALALAACGGATQQAPSPYAPTPAGSVVGAEAGQPVARPAGFATRPDCEKLVDHIDEIRFLSAPPAPRGARTNIFRAQNQSPDWHRARVDECTITVDPHDYVCLMKARDTTTASYCNAKFFASTMASYRQ